MFVSKNELKMVLSPANNFIPIFTCLICMELLDWNSNSFDWNSNSFSNNLLPYRKKYPLPYALHCMVLRCYNANFPFLIFYGFLKQLP